MATTKATTGFVVSRPFCHDEDAVLTIDLNDVRPCCCSSCDEEFSVETARDRAAEELTRWEAVCHWVEMATKAMQDA